MSSELVGALWRSGMTLFVVTQLSRTLQGPVPAIASPLNWEDRLWPTHQEEEWLSKRKEGCGWHMARPCGSTK